MSTAIILGTRPEIIKMSPVIREFEQGGIEFFILNKGQGNKSKVIFQTEFTGSTGSIHCKGCTERKARQHKSFYLEELIRPGTRISRIGRIYTDNTIRAYPCHPCNPCSIVNNLKGKISYQWLFYCVIEHGAMSIEFKPISATSAPASSWKNPLGDGKAAERIIWTLSGSYVSY